MLQRCSELDGLIQNRGAQLPLDIDPEGKYVLPTRVRTGRSVKGFQLPPTISFEDRRKLEALSVKALLAMEVDGLITKTTTPVLSRSVRKTRLQSRLLRSNLSSAARQITTVRAQCHRKLKETASEDRERGSYRRRLQNAQVLLQLRIKQLRVQMIRNWREAIGHSDPPNIDPPRCGSEFTASEPTASEAAIDANGYSAVTQEDVTQDTVMSPKRNKMRNTISELIKFHSNHSLRSVSAV